MTTTDQINKFIEDNTADAFGSVLGYVRTRDALNIALARLEAAEARAAQAEIDNDEMQSYINEIRVALHTEKDELTIDAVRRVIAERDEARRQLEQARAALIKIHEQSYRASLVQDRSVGIIKQACASISVDAKDAAVKAARP